MTRWPGYLPEVQDYEMRTRDEAKPHEPTRAELEDLFRDAVASLHEPDERGPCADCGDECEESWMTICSYCARQRVDEDGGDA